jgi:transcriptional regulator with XRE-family HTH domain
MPESFGARLRQQREERQITLATIAEQTKIKQSLLEALERDDVSRWPSGIFRRAFVRAYAHTVGLQPDIVVREFLEHHPDPVEEVATAVAEGGDGAPPANGLRQLVDAAVGSFSRLRLGTLERRIAQVAGSANTTAQSARVSIEAPANMSVAPESPANTSVATEAPAKISVESEAPATVAVEPEAPASASLETEPPLEPAAPSAPDLSTVARLCTELGRVDGSSDVSPLLQELAGLLDAVGLIVWVWDPQTTELTPALAHGYPIEVLAHLPNVKRDARNATAAAFRSAQRCIVNGGDEASDALVVPLMTPAGCTGVLAVELPHGGARRESVGALATIFAAQIARLPGALFPTEAADRRLA